MTQGTDRTTGLLIFSIMGWCPGSQYSDITKILFFHHNLPEIWKPWILKIPQSFTKYIVDTIHKETGNHTKFLRRETQQSEVIIPRRGKEEGAQAVGQEPRRGGSLGGGAGPRAARRGRPLARRGESGGAPSGRVLVWEKGGSDSTKQEKTAAGGIGYLLAKSAEWT